MPPSVRQEHRYLRLVRSTNDEASRRQREAEALFMPRAPRAAPVPPRPPARRAQVRAWMRANAPEYDCATTLAEGANAALDLPAGAMDDETHWVWDEALLATEGHAS